MSALKEQLFMQAINALAHPDPLTMPVLRAKLSPAQRREGQVYRSRLIEQLKNGQTKPLTIVSAPAGYGKTTAVAQWFDALNQPTAWLTLDRLDNDLVTFITYILASLQTAYPDDGHQTETLLHSPQDVPATILADALIEDLADMPGTLVLALDDYHLIQDGDVKAFMERLIHFLPTNIHLVLIGRTDPALSLSRLRAYGEVAEVHVADLHFSSEEARLLLSNMVGDPVDEQVAASLSEQTEGWVLGLQFAVLTRHRGETMTSLARRFGQEGHHLAADYLVDEVLAQQPPEVQDFLLRTSVLERMCAPLCQAVLDQSGQENMLDQLWRANLLVSPLDDQRVWFRYHPLFRETLRRRLRETAPVDKVGQLNKRAALWLVQEGLIGEAINHALAAGDQDMAVQLVADNLHPALNREEWWRVARWLDLLPEAARHHPLVLIARGWLAVSLTHILAIAQVANEAQTKLASVEVPEAERASLQAQIDTQKMIVAYWSGDDQTCIALAERALTALSPDMSYARGIVQFYFGMARYAVGHPKEVLAYFQEAMDSQLNERDSLLVRLVLAQCYVNLEIGDLPALNRSSNLMGKLASRSNLYNTRGWTYYAEALIAYEWNDLSQAEVLLQQVVSAPHNYNSRTTYESHLLLALTLQAQGRAGAADDILIRLGDFLVETNNLPILVFVDALASDLALMRGESAVLHTAATPGVDDVLAKMRLCFSVSPYLTRARGLIQQDTPECLQEASDCLVIMRQAAESGNLWRRLVKILALEALVAARNGQDLQAMNLLKQSLDLAKTGSLIRTYIDCGPALIPLLKELAATGTFKNYVQRILGAFVGDVTLESKQTLTPQTNDTLYQLRASLTNREQEVLLLLSKRMSNKEIAARLFLAPETVKKYTARIYQKLGVNNRRAAVSLAERVGLLSVL
jgi:LuxR family transcriptional regulator, maltose regulon positive regulatory protein